MVDRSKTLTSIIKYVLIIVAFSACTALKEISGEYSSRRIPYVFVLEKDSTFSYRYQFQFDHEYSLGNWKKLGRNKIALNSHYKDRMLKIEVEHSNTVTNDDLSLNILTPDFERSYYECLVYVDGSLHANQKCDSLISLIIKKPIQNVFLGFTASRTGDRIKFTRALDTLFTEKFYFQSPAFDKYTWQIVYNDSLFNYKVFNNETLKVTKKGLIFYDPRRETRQTIPKQ